MGRILRMLGIGEKSEPGQKKEVVPRFAQFRFRGGYEDFESLKIGSYARNYGRLVDMSKKQYVKCHSELFLTFKMQHIIF